MKIGGKPQFRSRMHAKNSGGGSNNQTQIRRSHFLLLKAARYLQLFTQFEVMEHPLVMDPAGLLRGPPTLDTLVEVLANHPRAVLVFDWSTNIPPMADLLLGVFGVSDTPWLVRQQLKNLHVVWLTELSEADAPLMPSLRTSMEEVNGFVQDVERIKAADPSLSSFAGPSAPKVLRADTNGFNVKSLAIETLVATAYDIAVWDADVPRALRLLYQGRELARLQSATTRRQNDSDRTTPARCRSKH